MNAACKCVRPILSSTGIAALVPQKCHTTATEDCHPKNWVQPKPAARILCHQDTFGSVCRLTWGAVGYVQPDSSLRPAISGVSTLQCQRCQHVPGLYLRAHFCWPACSCSPQPSKCCSCSHAFGNCITLGHYTICLTLKPPLVVQSMRHTEVKLPLARGKLTSEHVHLFPSNNSFAVLLLPPHGREKGPIVFSLWRILCSDWRSTHNWSVGEHATLVTVQYRKLS